MSDQMHKLGNDGMDMAMASLGVWNKNAEAIASELASYSKKSIDDTMAAWEKLMGAKSLQTAIDVQSQYLKSWYEDFVASSTKLGELYADLAKEAYKPFGEAAAKLSQGK